MNYFFIKDLKIENFFYNSSIYLHKELEDESSRENEKINSKIESSNIINQNLKFQQIETLINSNIKKNKTILRNKIHNIYNDIDHEDMEEIDYQNESEKLTEEKISSDKLIILQKPIFASNQQIDVNTFSILVLDLKNIYLGILIDKNILNLFEVGEK